MRKILLLLLFLGNISLFAQVKTPAQLYRELYDAVEMQRIYPDSKTFADASPLKKPQQILRDYNRQKNKPDFDLRLFVNQNFTIPAANSTPYRSNIKAGVRHHIEELWSVLQHVADTAKGTSLLPLPYPYVVPGGRFREVYYWDSYFTMIGLQESHRYNVVESMVKNFAWLIDTYGHIPNGNRSYYLTRSQPPFFALMVELLALQKGKQTFVQYQPELLAEYEYWMKGLDRVELGSAYDHVVGMPDGSILNRYYDSGDQPREESYREDVLSAQNTQQDKAGFYRNMRSAAESGWDFSSRWLADGKTLGTIQTVNLVPVDLNCLLYHLETVIAQSYQVSGNTGLANSYTTKANKRKAAIIKYCWDEATGCFKDFNWKQNSRSPQITIATAFPLYFNLATPQQSAKVARLISSKFVKSGGVAATLTATGQQWDRPNGWAPLEYITVMGLRNYHQDKLAQTIAVRWIRLNVENFKKTGKLSEKYDIENLHSRAGGGEYPNQDGFGWTNGVLLKLMNLYGVK